MSEPTPSADPVLAAIQALDARLSRMEARIDQLAGYAEPLPAAVAVATDVADGLARQIGEEKVDAHLRASGRALAALTDPAVVAALEAIVPHLPALAALAGHAAQADNVVATVTDTFDGLVARAAADGIDVDARAHNLLAAAERLTSPQAIEALQLLLARLDVLHALLESGVFDKKAVSVVAAAGTALVETRDASPDPVGAWGLLGALSDPDVKRAAGFAVHFARAFGRLSAS